ncbi:MAG TPA: Gfo/Idh/MocA family oxidoreductase [Candidatus Acidoferrales bacterium]|nr:Gfo/Idh/MocA family oxidoreductase [Candidatus Acidoferrales bacterium]
MNRRYFLGSAVSAGTLLRPVAAASANDTVRVACVGVRGRGRDHIRAYSKMANVEIAAVCDIDESILNARVGEIEKAGGRRPAAFTDFRKLLEDKTIDAVSIATPNHHHTLQTIWACQAGKDVYVEKPCSHDMFEARQIAAAAQKYKRLVQHGTQQRSSVGRDAVQKMREGLLGDVYMARGLCYKRRDTIGRKPVSPVPPGVHYDLWLGPAPVHEFTANRFHYNWHWFWDYGNGDLGNQGVHQLDMARWGLGVKYPAKVTAIGGHFMFDDDQETPNTLVASYEFHDGGVKKMLVFEVRHWITNHEAGIDEPNPGNTVGTVFYGSKGYLSVWDEDHSKYYSFLGREQTPGPSGNEPGNHWANFIEAVRSRKQSDLNAPIEEGAISTTLIHLANISYRLGRTLNFDAAKYSCTGDAEATAMFRRTYRKPFEVPEKV